MQARASIVFDGLLGTSPLRRAVERRIAELEARFGRFASWRVVVARGSRHGPSRFLYSVRIDLRAGATSIVAGRGQSSATPHDNVHSALEASFNAAERQLQEHEHRSKGARRRRALSAGRVIALFPQDVCGILRTRDGRKLDFEYGAFDGGTISRLDVGDSVVFIEEPNGTGSRASGVRLSHRVRPAAGAA